MFLPRIIASLLILCSLPAAAQSGNIRKELAGTWKLESATQILEDGTRRDSPLYPHGTVAWLIYTEGGDMCVLFDAEKAANAYCGRYELNEAQRYVIHNIAVKDAPSADQPRVDDVGAGLKRYVSIEGQELTLKIVQPRSGIEQERQTWVRDHRVD